VQSLSIPHENWATFPALKFLLGVKTNVAAGKFAIDELSLSLPSLPVFHLKSRPFVSGSDKLLGVVLPSNQAGREAVLGRAALERGGSTLDSGKPVPAKSVK
jgi:hypothetical protein